MTTQSNFFKRKFHYPTRVAAGLIALFACVTTGAEAFGQAGFKPISGGGQLPSPKFSNGPSATPALSQPTQSTQLTPPAPSKFASPSQTAPARRTFPSQVTPRRARSTSSLGTPKSTQSDSRKITVPFCSIEFVDDIKLPALEAGAVVAINVQEGQFITAGTIVGQIDDSLPHFELDRSKMRYQNAFQAAKDTSNVMAAKKEYELARSVYEKNRRLSTTGSRSESEVKESRFRMEIAKLKMEKAINDRQMAFGEAKVELAGMDSVKQRIARHTLRSDYNAYVVDIFKKPQEYVNVGDEVMRLARMDQMWVQASLNSRNLNAADAENRPVTVTLQTANGSKETFEGKIDQVSLEMVSAKEYQVKIKVQNRKDGNAWMLRPFSSVSMVIHMDREPISDATTASRPQQAQLPVVNN